MASHFLLTSKARLLSPIKIAKLSDDETLSMLCQLRWRSNNEQVCPKCVLKHRKGFCIRTPILSAAFGRLCVETGRNLISKSNVFFSRLRAAVC